MLYCPSTVRIKERKLTWGFLNWLKTNKQKDMMKVKRNKWYEKNAKQVWRRILRRETIELCLKELSVGNNIIHKHWKIMKCFCQFNANTRRYSRCNPGILNLLKCNERDCERKKSSDSIYPTTDKWMAMEHWEQK